MSLQRKAFQGKGRSWRNRADLNRGLVPDGADSVIMVEDTEHEGSEIKCFKDQHWCPHTSKRRRCPNRRGSSACRHDHPPAGNGHARHTGHIGMFISVRLSLYSQPATNWWTWMSRLSDGKIVCSNSYSLAAQIMECGAIPISLGIASDDETDQREKIPKVFGLT